MKREFLITGDGSVTINLPEWNEQYHSKHGALIEAQHVFIENGLRFFISKNQVNEVSILEIGFGTGLNAYLTYLETEKEDLKIKYSAIEGFPILLTEIEQFNYPQLLNDSSGNFQKFHTVAWEKMNPISEAFQLCKRKLLFSEIEDEDRYNIIYFDAFSMRVQPELWTEEIFLKMFNALKENGILVTYASNGNARRAMQSAGFIVEKIPGPPFKREMLRALKKI